MSWPAPLVVREREETRRDVMPGPDGITYLQPLAICGHMSGDAASYLRNPRTYNES